MHAYTYGGIAIYTYNTNIIKTNNTSGIFIWKRARVNRERGRLSYFSWREKPGADLERRTRMEG